MTTRTTALFRRTASGGIALALAAGCAARRGGSDSDAIRERELMQERATQQVREQMAAQRRATEPERQRREAEAALAVESNRMAWEKEAEAKRTQLANQIEAGEEDAARRKEEACAEGRPTRVAALKALVREHEDFIREVHPKLDWYRAHCGDVDTRAVETTVVQRSGNTVVTRSRRVGSAREISCNAPRPKGMTNEWIEAALYEANCEYQNISLSGTALDAPQCAESDKKALGMPLEVVCGGSKEDLAALAKVLALP